MTVDVSGPALEVTSALPEVIAYLERLGAHAQLRTFDNHWDLELSLDLP